MHHFKNKATLLFLTGIFLFSTNLSAGRTQNDVFADLLGLDRIENPSDVEKRCGAIKLQNSDQRRRSSVIASGTKDPIKRPGSPIIDLDPDMLDGYDHLTEHEKQQIRSLALEERLKVNDALSKRIRLTLQKRPQMKGTLAGGLIYDDGSASQGIARQAFNNFFEAMNQENLNGNFTLNNTYNCDFGNHATAVTATMLQTCPSVPYPITIVGGDGRRGHMSNGESIDDRFAPFVMKDLRNDVIRHQKLGNPVVFNASYGVDARGDFGDKLDEAGVWRTFWDEVKGGVVVQAAGNEANDLSPTDATLMRQNAFETAHNMEFTFATKNYAGRLIHALSSVPDTDKNHPTLDTSFSNYYSYKNTAFVHFARDHSMMAPGSYIFIPMDPFDSDKDGKYHVAADQLNEWSGTSAAAPVISGAILRLVNEFGITAQKAAAVLLETSDFIYEPRVQGNLKSLNLGAALAECMKQEIIAEIKRGHTEKHDIFVRLLKTMFDDRPHNLSLAEQNFLSDIADRCGRLHVRSSSKKHKYDRLKNMARRYVRKGSHGDEKLYYKKKRGGLNVYFFKKPGQVYLKTIAPVETEYANVVDFKLRYTDTVDAPTPAEFKLKGILGAKIKTITEAPNKKGKVFLVRVQIPEKFNSKRLLSLHVPDALILGKQDNQALFDGEEFVF